jgi:alkaline phosphatase
MRLRALCTLIGPLSLLFAACLGWDGVRADTPRNVILLIGDGMGPGQLELARRFAADGKLAMDRLDPSPGWMTTHNAVGGVTDSAAAGTALATGRKTRNRAISMVPDPERRGALVPVETGWERAEAAGKSTGIVTSVYLADATPGVWAAHAVNRYEHRAIALQQAADNPAGDVEVLLGAGTPHYLPQPGEGEGGRNLIEELQAAGYEFVRNAGELRRATAPGGKLLGLFADENLTYALDRSLEKDLAEPTLTQMTAKALEILRRDEEGFFLVVEGGAIDWQSHERDPAGVLHEMRAFDAAVAVARDFAEADGNTLVIVTADHETGGLALPADPAALNRAFLTGIRATSSYIWEQIQKDATLEDAMRTYAGIGEAWPALTRKEKRRIEACDDGQGVADVLSTRAGVSWEWSGCKGGDHTPAKVAVFAMGPGAERLDAEDLDNTDIGELLLEVVSAK